MCREKNSFWLKLLPYGALLLAALALGIRGMFSFCWSDEPFYFSTVHRFLQGDHIFVHEWFPTQLVSLILLPFQWAYESLTGGTDGIILYFRLLYVILSLLIALGIFRILRRRQGDVCALLCALFYQFYAHLNIATMSYYTLSVSFLLLSMLLVCDAKEKAWDRRSLILSGSVFALAVLSLPSLAVAYFLCTAMLVLISVRVRSLRRIFPMMLMGILIPAVLVLLYVLPTSGLGGILDNLPYVLSDEEHVTSLVYPFKKFFLSVTDVFTYLAWCPVLLALVAAGLQWYERFVLPRKEQTEAVPGDGAEKREVLFRRARFTLFCLDLALFLFFLPRAAGHTGYISTVLILFALPLFFLTPKRNDTLFLTVYLGGLILSMTYSYSSNGDLYVMTLGHSVSAVAAICMIYDYARYLPEVFVVDEKGERRLYRRDLLRILCGGVVLAALIQTVTLRFVNVYRDAPLPALTEQLSEGPGAGLYTTPAHAASYREVLSLIRESREPGKNLLITKLLPWGYLASDMRCGAPTTWRTKLSSDRLRLYYETRPEKVPDVILVLKEEIGAYDSCGDVEADPAPNANEEQGWLADYIREMGYEKRESSVGTVYRR